jgi:hypothetical protein
MLVNGGFIDADNGWISVMRCTDPYSNDFSTCTFTRAITDDGGATFRTIAYPSGATDAALYMFDSTHLVLYQPVGPRWTSADGGRTWVETSGGFSQPVRTVPPGDLLADSTDGVDGADIVVVLAPDGSVRKLTHAPAGAHLLSAHRGRPVDGVYLLAGEPDTLQVSPDQGATWHPAQVGGAEPATVEMDVYGDGAAFYLVLNAQALGDHPTLETSTDHGATWKDLTWPADGAFPVPDVLPPNDIFAGYDGRSAMYLPGSGLYASNGLSWWHLDPQTSRFNQVNLPPSLLWQNVAGALVSMGTDPDHPSESISTDGTHWHLVHMP